MLVACVCVCVCVGMIFCWPYRGEIIKNGDDVLHDQSVLESFFFFYYYYFLARILRRAFYIIWLSLVRPSCRVFVSCCAVSKRHRRRRRVI